MKETVKHDHNVLFVTLDSCRWDTYQRANTPTLDAIADARSAQTPGNYTLPAHSSFFVGHLPVIQGYSNIDFYTRRGAQLWRLRNARRIEDEVGVALGGDSVFEGYREKGYIVRGFGGVSFFAHPETQLRRLFENGEFTHFGTSIIEYPRAKQNLPLSNPEKIIDSVVGYDDWFVFINESATHPPYHVNGLTDKLSNLLGLTTPLRGGKGDSRGLSYEQHGKPLHTLQVEALEYVDQQLALLLSGLPKTKPLMVVICGDHGESFGENGFWGHLNNTPEVLTVPLLVNTNYHHEKS